MHPLVLMPRRITAVAVLATLAVALVARPAAAQKISDPELFAKSLEVAQQALDQYGRYDDREQQERVSDIGYRLAREANFDAFPLTFHLIDMPEPNAFALPAGQIFVTRGMLDLGLDDDMLAALLGHEIAHVVERHYAQMKRRATIMQVLSQALLVGVLVGAGNDSRGAGAPYRSPEPYGSGGKGELVQGAAATSLIVSELLLRGYSREHEDQADEDGQRWAAAAGFDPLGAQKLMAHMGSRLPQSETYGYWRTHPFFNDRVRAAAARGALLKQAAEPRSADELRQRTQAVLVDYLANATPKPKPELVPLLQEEALAAWPQGEAADGIRLDRLHKDREAELAHPELERDYGRLLAAYDTQIDAVAALTPESPFLATAGSERAELATQRDGLYPRAVEVLTEGVFETAFLERFLSNWPEAPEVPAAALRLGDAQARLGRQTEAVASYLEAWQSAPDSPEGKRAAAGLRNLAPALDQLAALQQLAVQNRDAELARLAATRLEEAATSFERLENGAEYLRRYPEGEQVQAVQKRLDALADNLYAEVVLYQALGDNVKAVDRINRILTHAPLSHAAEQLRDRAVIGA